MTRKTKAELEAENAELRSLVAELEHDNQNLRGHIKLLNQMWVEDQRDLKIETTAHQDTIDKAIVNIDAKLEAQHKLAERNSGVNKINKNAPDRTEYIKGRFSHYRKDGHNLTNARDLANNDLANSEFKYRYKDRWLIHNLKD